MGGGAPAAARLVLAACLAATAASIKGPPRLTLAKNSENRVVTVGDDLRLKCPVEGSPTPIFEWSKDGETISDDSWERYRIQGQNLRVKGVTLRDEGSYECIGVNGFGQAKFIYVIKVDDPLAISADAASVGNGRSPRLKQSSPMESSALVVRPLGYSIIFRCVVEGDPEPTLSWFKDGLDVTEKMFKKNWKFSRFGLHVNNLTMSDSGIYTCVGINQFGSIATNWTLKIIEEPYQSSGSWPLQVNNATVMEGTSAILKCRGTSEVMPHIKWLRRVEKQDGLRIPENETIPWKGHRYKVLHEADVYTSKDGTFITKLTVPNVTARDAGIYVCTATNKLGLSYREASLVVIGRNSERTTLFLLVGLSLVAMLVIIGALVITLRRRKGNKPSPRPGPSERSLLPQTHSLKDDHFAPSKQHPRYVCHPPLPPEGRLHVLTHQGSVISSQAARTSPGPGQPMVMYQEPGSTSSPYITSRPSGGAQSIPEKTEYRYQQLDVI